MSDYITTSDLQDMALDKNYSIDGRRAAMAELNRRRAETAAAQPQQTGPTLADRAQAARVAEAQRRYAADRTVERNRLAVQVVDLAATGIVPDGAAPELDAALHGHAELVSRYETLRTRYESALETLAKLGQQRADALVDAVRDGADEAALAKITTKLDRVEASARADEQRLGEQLRAFNVPLLESAAALMLAGDEHRESALTHVDTAAAAAAEQVKQAEQALAEAKAEADRIDSVGKYLCSLHQAPHAKLPNAAGLPTL